MTAIQELIRQLKGAIQLIDEHGVLNDYAQCRKEVYESVLDNAVSLAASQNNQGEGNCKCDNEIKTGQTSAMCCNICGLPDDENWKVPSPLPGTTVQGYSEADMYQCALQFFYHWWNQPGNNTAQGLQEWLPQFIQSLNKK